MNFKLIAFVLLVSLVGYGQQVDHNLNGIDDEINLLMNEYKAVGLSVAVVKDNEIIFSKGFGYRNLDDKLPVSPNTIFPIGSITKSFTGAVLGVLENENRLSLKDKPSEYISGLSFYNDKMNALITIEDLLSHKSGIGNQGTTQIFFPDSSIIKNLQRLRYLKPESEVKNSFAYSNMAYTIAGGIIEEVTGQSWEENIKNTIFQPLNMVNSFTAYDEMKNSGDFSIGYGLYKDEIVKVPYEKMYAISPAGAVKSTALDMCNWMKAWLNNGYFQEEAVLPESYVKNAMTLHNIGDDNYEKDAFLFGDGLGWRLRSSYGHYRVEHGGNSFGFSSELMMFPFEKIGIVVLTNQNLSLLPYMVADIIVRRLFQLETTIEYPISVEEVYKPELKSKGLNKEKMPTHSLNDYEGNYMAKGYGEISIMKVDDGLLAVFPTYDFKLEHLYYNSFYLKGTEDFNEPYSPEFNVKFNYNPQGEISTLQLYSQKEPIDFIKQQ